MRKKFLILICILIISLSCVTPACAVFYDSDFPEFESGLTGGKFYTCYNGSTKYTIILPVDKVQYLSLTSEGLPVNCSSSTIYGLLFIDTTSYDLKIPSFSVPQYDTLSHNSSSYSTNWVYINYPVEDTNIEFLTEDSDYYNNNLYFDKYQIAVLSCLIILIILTLLNWWLLHR